MLSTEQLFIFKTAAEQGSFSAAARLLNKTPAAISISISNLEIQLGIDLFDRSTKYPRLTSAGERLYQQCTLLVRHIERIESAATSYAQQVEDKVTIGIDRLIPSCMIESGLQKLASDFPNTAIHIVRDTNANLQSRIELHELDLVLQCTTAAEPKSLEFFDIALMEMCCVCAPDSDLADTAIVDNEALLTRRQICCESMIENPSLSLQGRLSPEIWVMTDQEDVLNMVEQGLGWAFVPKVLAKQRQEVGSLLIINPEFSCTEILCRIDLWCAPSKNQGRVVKQLVGQIKQIANF
ncbi:LysR family transcriptional regulator [Vibrio mediterranei]|uniref:LysR family transcriptional regulator n=1 Tax=Vibrio mediterranei TaxID=689 RepID=UPI00148D4B24|nr:LysR family transcriptional regulator [Vibrio mediterranei]NOI24886.1 LysR family transcriptional regulator [Vibrio mediterranei]